jgi:3-oxoacyl-[acyl-carrier protein] reductase
MDLEFEGKVALVTGASRGLGLEIARELAAGGANVALAATEPAALGLAAEQVKQVAGAAARIVTHVVDLAVEQSVTELAGACENALGPIDILINNAAIQGPIGAFESLPWETWRRVIEVDFLAAARLCQLVIPAMKRRGRGKIVNISGGGATGPRPDFSAYAAAKTALVRLTETLAEELREARIDINAVAPGPMNTRMLDETLAAGPDAAKREYAAAAARAREGGTPPRKAAELVAWLASRASDGITGKLISAVWDDWQNLAEQREQLARSDVYTLRRIVPKDRGM